MRLGTKKLICIRKGRETKKFLAFFVILIIFCFISFFVAYFLETVRPVMITLAKTKSEKLALFAINDAVITIFADGKVSYKDVLVLDKDESGKVTSAQSNLEGINLIKAKLTNEIQKNIERVSVAKLKIPIGTLLGTDILAGVGPRINVEFVPYGVSKIDFSSTFEDAGINQTRLVISLDVCATVGLLMPTVNTNIEVKTTVPVIQTIIVGEVPNSYTNVDREGLDYEDDILQLAE